MAVSRRTFLRVLGSAAVAAVAAPSIPMAVAAPRTYWDFDSPIASVRPLTYDMLRQAYESCVIGPRGPNMMVISTSMARQFGLVYDVEVEG